MSKTIFVCGGVISGTGKGVSAASIGLLLKLRGYSVQLIKFDPYLNVNAGIIRPTDHGECFLCEDGTETDLDLGHYERITGVNVSKKNICTSGILYKELIEEQEKGVYLGQSIQVVPHITNKIQERLKAFDKDCDILIAEIGGTVGDIESSAFYEAMRKYKQKCNGDVIIMMVSPILWVPTIKEFKTKPLQNSVKDLQTFGLQPDILLCRVDREISPKLLDKISEMTGVPRECVFDAPDVETIYQVPIEFYNRHVDDIVVDMLHLKRTACRIYKHRDLVEKYVGGHKDMPIINIGVFGKYDNCDEAYISIKEALYHSGVSCGTNVNIKWIKAEELENYKDMRGIAGVFENLHGVIIPGGFDNRGVEGKIRAIRYAREKKIPFLGLCLGLQCAVIEFARSVCGIEKANSMEFDVNTPDPVIHYVEGQKDIAKKSGTMRLGSYECELLKPSIAFNLFNKRTISERHRHRLEVNPKYLEVYKQNGFFVSGFNPQTNLVEIMELDQKIHPFFVGTQAHPEFKSRLMEPSPFFNGLVSASLNYFKNKKENNAS